MTPVFALSSHAAQPYPAIAGAEDPSKIHPSENPARKAKTEKNDTDRKPVKDEYLPEEKPEPAGRYWMEKTENGKSKVYFDDPNQAPKTDNPDENPKTGNAKESPQKPEPKTCKGNNDEAVREIEKLKERKKALEQQIHRETDEVKARKLEQELKQVENELRQKDNHSYLRQHTTFTPAVG